MTSLPRNTADVAQALQAAPAPRVRTLDANEAVARIAYRLSEVIAIAW